MINLQCPNDSKCEIAKSCSDCVGPAKNTERTPDNPGTIKEIGGGWYWVNGEKVRGRKNAEEKLKNDNPRTG